MIYEKDHKWVKTCGLSPKIKKRYIQLFFNFELFLEFLDEVRNSLASNSQECAHTVEKTFREVSNLLKTASGQSKVIEKFG